MTNIREVLRKRSEHDAKFQQKVAILRCVTVGIDYEYNSSVKNRPGYIWVREQKLDGAVFQVFNASVKTIVGLNVIVSSEYGTPYRKIVTGIDWDSTPITSTYPNSNSPSVYNHALSHEWRDTYPGADAITIYPRSVAPLRVYPAKSGALKLDIAEGIYGASGNFVMFEGQEDYDITAYKPASGYVGVLIYLDAVLGTIQSVKGDTVSTEAALVYPDLINQTLPLAYVRLVSTATYLTESDIVMDLRPMYNFVDKSILNSIGALENELDVELTRHIVQGV
ncbi:MAG: hypothetical protein WC479_05295 [Candidatus Izemoplasmatales bacterium]|jgi:hypothetical protein